MFGRSPDMPRPGTSSHPAFDPCNGPFIGEGRAIPTEGTYLSGKENRGALCPGGHFPERDPAPSGPRRQGAGADRAAATVAARHRLNPRLDMTPSPALRHGLNQEYLTDRHQFFATLSQRSEVVGREAACGHWIRVHRRAMACRFEITLPAADGAFVPAAMRALDEIDRLEQELSVFIPTSAISGVNRDASNRSVVVPAYVAELLAAASACIGTPRAPSTSRRRRSAAAGASCAGRRECRGSRRSRTRAGRSASVRCMCIPIRHR